MTNLKRRSVWAVALAMFALFAIPDAVAQRRGGGSRSRSTPRRSTPSKPRTKAAPKKTATKKTTTATKEKAGYGKKSTKASSSKGSKADKALYEKAKRNGTSYKTRGEATSAFKTKMANQKRADGNPMYSSKYVAQPGTRPGHIPQTYGGNTIIYNQQYGGYGHMGVGGWMMYNAMADATMMSMMMRNQGYHYGAAPRYGPGVGLITLTVVCGIIAVVAVGVVITRKSTA
jgi:hypothetical protein